MFAIAKAGSHGGDFFWFNPGAAFEDSLCPGLLSFRPAGALVSASLGDGGVEFGFLDDTDRMGLGCWRRGAMEVFWRREFGIRKSTGQNDMSIESIFFDTF